MFGFLHFINAYAVWHYTNAPSHFVRIWGNFLWFFYHFFSIPTLLRTFFVPWHRLKEESDGGFHFQEWLTNKVVNMMMRLVGAFMRATVILFGVIVLTITAVGGALAFVVWLLLPAVVVGLLFIAEYLLV